jgi:acyl-CoA thioesterase FadM
MRILFHLIPAFWATRGGGRRGIDATTVLKLRVWPQDIDLNWHMNNGRYFSVADIGRFDWWIRTGIWRKAMQRGWRPVAGDVDARFSRSLLPLQRYELRTRLLGWDEKWMFALHEFAVGDRVHTTLLVRYVFVSNTRPRPTPAQVLKLIGVDQPSPALPEWVRLWTQAQDRLAADRRAERAA